MNNFKGFTNTKCEFFPCHSGIKRKDFNCIFCFCPLMSKECPGPYTVLSSKYGKLIKDCSACSLPHDGIEQSWRFIQMWVPVTPLWDGKEQSLEKIKQFSSLVKEKFDMNDIRWAEKEISSKETKKLE